MALQVGAMLAMEPQVEPGGGGVSQSARGCGTASATGYLIRAADFQFEADGAA